MVLAVGADRACAGDSEPVREGNPGARAEVHCRVPSPLVKGESDPATLVRAA
jgi:hypothetical protein